MDTKFIVLAVGAVAAVVLIIVGVTVDSASKKQQAQPRSSTSKSSGLKVTLMVVGLVLLAIGGAVGYCYISSTLAEGRLRDKYGDQIVDLCMDPKGVPDPSNLPTAYVPWKVVVLEDVAARADWHKRLPDERRAEDKASTNIVVCVDTQSKVLETCEYTQRTLDRVQHYVEVSLFNAENLQMITTFLIWGSIPEACPDMITRYTPSLRGDDPLETTSPDYFAVFYDTLLQTVR